MAKNKEEKEKKENENRDVPFTPTGTGIRTNGQIVRGTELPKPTRKKHKSLGLSEEDLLDMFEQMFLQRRFEERAYQMYQKGKFGGFLHLYMGQEAVSTGTVYALNDDDDIITAYRDHGWGLVRGVSAKEGMAELYGKVTGCSKGKGGSMHFANADQHLWGGFAIVGAHIPVGAGIAFANKYQENDRICICFIGDGAVDQGALHETLNMAKLWNLPFILAVENNGYAMGTAVHRHTVGEIHERAKAYDIKSDVINGMDVFSVYDQMKEAADEVRETREPQFIEIRTYRYRGHSMSDPSKYRTKEEIEEYQELDPIERIKSYLLDNDIADEDKIEEIKEKVEQEVDEALEFADESSFPEKDELYKDVYVEDDYPFHK